MKKFRVHNEASNEKFKNLIENENLDQVFANEQYNEFCKIYTTHYNSSFPLKQNRTCTKNVHKNPKPWILPWLEDACRHKNDLHFTSVDFSTKANIYACKKMNKLH